MYFAIVTVFSSLVLFFYFFALRNTVFGVSLKSGNFTGSFHLLQLLVYTLPAVLALNYYPIDMFWVAFKVQGDSVGWISLVLLSSYLLFLVALKLISNLSPRIFYFERPQITNKQAAHYRRFVWASVLLLLLLVSLAWIILGVRNSFELAFLDDVGLSAQRYARSQGAVTSLIKYTCIILPKFLIAIVASRAFLGRHGQKAILILLMTYFSSWAGNKGPIIELFIIYFLVWATASGRSFRLVDALRLVALAGLILLLLFFLVSVQYEGINNSSLFFGYFLQRTFVAQSIGFYEQFNLHIQSLEYFWHGVPFADLFLDFPVFQKDLMLYSEDRYDPSNIGIKNTFFVAEAYGMGGAWFIVPAIFIYALNYCLSYTFIVMLLNRMVAKNREMNKLIAAAGFFSFVNVTGGFSDLMLFKVTIMMTILMAPFIAAGVVSRLNIRRL